MHLSFKELRAHQYDMHGEKLYINKFADKIDIDSELFFSQPTSYFILDSLIPEKLESLFMKQRIVENPIILSVHLHV